jgi:hypothetical protein
LIFKGIKETEEFMAEPKRTREQLEKRRAEILAELNEVGEDARIELDNDPEEQSIQIEQHQVAVTMEANLRKELAEIEDRLAELDEQES